MGIGNYCHVRFRISLQFFFFPFTSGTRLGWRSDRPRDTSLIYCLFVNLFTDTFPAQHTYSRFVNKLRVRFLFYVRGTGNVFCIGCGDC